MKTELLQTMHLESGFQIPPNWPEIGKMTMMSQFSNMMSQFSNIIIKFFWHCFFSLTVLSYWSKFHVNIITGSGVVAIFFYKGVTRNPEIGNNPIWVLPNIWRLGQVGIPNLARMSLIKCYWMLQNDRVTAFTVSELLREIQQGGVKLPPPPPTPPRLGLMRLYH